MQIKSKFSTPPAMTAWLRPTLLYSAAAATSFYCGIKAGQLNDPVLFPSIFSGASYVRRENSSRGSRSAYRVGIAFTTMGGIFDFLHALINRREINWHHIAMAVAVGINSALLWGDHATFMGAQRWYSDTYGAAEHWPDGKVPDYSNFDAQWGTYRLRMAYLRSAAEAITMLAGGVCVQRTWRSALASWQHGKHICKVRHAQDHAPRAPLRSNISPAKRRGATRTMEVAPAPFFVEPPSMNTPLSTVDGVHQLLESLIDLRNKLGWSELAGADPLEIVCARDQLAELVCRPDAASVIETKVRSLDAQACRKIAAGFAVLTARRDYRLARSKRAMAGKWTALLKSDASATLQLALANGIKQVPKPR